MKFECQIGLDVNEVVRNLSDPGSGTLMAPDWGIILTLDGELR